MILTPYEHGWIAGKRRRQPANPYAEGSEEHREYADGYADGCREDDGSASVNARNGCAL